VKRKTAMLIGLLVIGACASTTLILQKGPHSGTLEVHVEGLEHQDGNLRFALFAGPEGFPSDPALAERVETLPITSSTVTWTVEEVPTGMWAVSVLHDEDGNGEMATGWMGQPSEGWGTSNDARGRFGPPSFEDAAFEMVAPGTRIVIHLTY
jgi:uncharacterized protein (DUF2141 family)